MLRFNLRPFFFFLAQILEFEFQAINFSSRLLQASYQHLSTNSEWILMCGAWSSAVLFIDQRLLLLQS